MKKLLLSVVSSSAIIVSLLTGSAAAAGSASLSMTSKSVVVGNTVAVSISANSGADTVNVVQADFTYDTSKLQFVGVSCGGGFESTASASQNSVACFTMTPKSGAQSVATASFKALAGSGSSAISFMGSSHIYRSTDNVDIWNGSAAGATISFTSPAPVVTPAPATTAPKPSVAKPAAPQSAIPGVQTTPVATTTTPEVLAESTTAAVKSYTVAVKVVDGRGNIVVGADVTLNGITTKTGNDGMANFTDVLAGKYQVKVVSKNVKDTTTKVSIAKEGQKMLVSIPTVKKSKRWFFFGSIATIAGLGALAYADRRHLSKIASKAVKKARKVNPVTAAPGIALTAAPLKSVSKKPGTVKKTVNVKK